MPLLLLCFSSSRVPPLQIYTCFFVVFFLVVRSLAHSLYSLTLFLLYFYFSPCYLIFLALLLFAYTEYQSKFQNAVKLLWKGRRIKVNGQCKPPRGKKVQLQLQQQQQEARENPKNCKCALRFTNKIEKQKRIEATARKQKEMVGKNERLQKHCTMSTTKCSQKIANQRKTTSLFTHTHTGKYNVGERTLSFLFLNVPQRIFSPPPQTVTVVAMQC